MWSFTKSREAPHSLSLVACCFPQPFAYPWLSLGHMSTWPKLTKTEDGSGQARIACKPGKWILLEHSLLGHVSPSSGDLFVSPVGWLLLQTLQRVRKHKGQLDVFEVKMCPGGGHLPGSLWVGWCGVCPSNWRDGAPLFRTCERF